MKHRNYAALLAAAAITIVSATAGAQPSGLNRTVERAANCSALDGDTLRCGSIRVRLVGVDAAELPGHCRQGRICASGDPYRQREALARLATGQLTIVPLKIDKYQRMIARVRSANGSDLSCAMLAAGATYRSDWDEHNIVARTCPSQASRARAR